MSGLNSPFMEKTLEISNLLDTVLKGLKLGADELKTFAKIGIREYLKSQIEKYDRVNTFLYRGDKVQFESIYYPIKITDGKRKTDFKKSEEFLLENKYISVVGIAGSGKSTLVKYIFRQTLNKAFKIPILIELRNLNHQPKTFEETVLDIIVKKGIKPNPAIVRRALRSGQFVFILDGFDEIYRDNKDRLIHALNEFIDIYPENNYIITSRPEAGIEALDRFRKYTVCPLTKTDIKRFVQRMVPDPERRTRIMETVEKPDNMSISPYFENPLLLSMFILAFESYPEIPTRKTTFYRNVFDTLYSKHDGVTKSSYQRERLSKLQRDDFEGVLQLLSYLSYTDSKFSFTDHELSDYLQRIKDYRAYDYEIEALIGDLSVSLSILIKDGLEYSFPHRSMQEYFYAMLMSGKTFSDDNKRVIYSRLLDENTTGMYMYSHRNLIDLCNEVDEISVFEYYTKFILEDFLQNMTNSSDPVVITESILNYYPPNVYTIYNHFYVSFMDDNPIFVLPAGVYPKINFDDYLLNLENELKASVKIRNIAMQNVDLTFKQLSDKYSDLFAEFYLKSGVAQKVIKLRENIRNYLVEMEEKQSKNKQLSSLLAKPR